MTLNKYHIDTHRLLNYTDFSQETHNSEDIKERMKEVFSKEVIKVLHFIINVDTLISPKQRENLPRNLKIAIDRSNHEPINLYHLHGKNSKSLIIGAQKGPTGSINNALMQELLSENPSIQEKTHSIEVPLSEILKISA